MELELGLSISRDSAKGLDLNIIGVEFKEDFEVGFNHFCNERLQNLRKRGFEESFGETSFEFEIPRTLPLLTWDDKNLNQDEGEEEEEEEEEVDYEDESQNKSIVNECRNAGEDTVVGWPPLKSSRKKLCLHGQRPGNNNLNYVRVENGGGPGGGRGSSSNSFYVKVKMEGVGIARKIDLNLHHSYQELTHTLIGMFGKNEENGQAYELTYQDKEGDWLLAGDVPWGTFIQSVQRLKLLKKGR